jgi:hypothetical protein
MFEAKIPPPIPHRRDDAEGHWIETLVAYDPGDSRAAFLRCCLAPIPEADPGCFEFWFDIYVVSDNEDREPFGVQDGRHARPFVPGEIRRLVLDCVVDALVSLVEEVGPRSIYRVAKSAGLPDKAMAKHYRIAAALERLGYRIVESGTDPAKRTYWLASRNEY